MVRRFRFPLLYTSLFAVFSVFATAGQATTVRYRALGELVRHSDATVLARAVGQRSFWLDGRIVTEHSVEVDEAWAQKVALPPRLKVLSLGGVVDGIGQRVDGSATLPPHGRMVLHLRQAGDHFIPSGMSQGVWWVESIDGPDGQLLRLGGDRLLMAHRAKEPAPPPHSLAELRRQVMEAARER